MEEKIKGEGFKHDQGKLDLTLIPPVLLEETARVLMHGAAKYDRHNWAKVPDADLRYAAALYRHFLAWLRGEIVDPESGRPHLAHMSCCIAFLLAFAEAGRESSGWRIEVPHQLELPFDEDRADLELCRQARAESSERIPLEKVLKDLQLEHSEHYYTRLTEER